MLYFTLVSISLLIISLFILLYSVRADEAYYTLSGEEEQVKLDADIDEKILDSDEPEKKPL